MKPKEISEKLRVDVSTIYRELKRGRYERLNGQTWEMETSYSPDIAEARYQENLRNKGPELKIGNDHELAKYIEDTIIERDCSPAAALGYAEIEGKEFKTKITVQTVYTYIHKGVFLRLKMEDCPRHNTHKNKYQHVGKTEPARAPAGESIDNRPEEVKDRKVFGHWEMDTVYSAKNQGKAVLLTITERKTRKEIIVLLPNRKAETITKAVNALERKFGAVKFRAIFKSITVDNGSEFSAAADLEKSCINKTMPRTKVYYAHPYSSWERGTNENSNGMIRRKLPKGTAFENVSAADVAAVEAWMNTYPRKVLGYKSSEMAYREELAALGIAA
jgi:IS30 family transposase